MIRCRAVKFEWYTFCMSQNQANSKLRVAIAHDWLVGGGAEKVVLELHRMFPDAPIYTTYCSDEWREKLDGKVVTGYLQRFGGLRKFLPLLQYYWFRSLKLRGYDLVISTTGNGMAKAVQPPKGTKYVCYCHTPVHYLWRHYDSYLKDTGFSLFGPVARVGLRMQSGTLRKKDYAAAQRVDYFIGNSTHIAADIKRFYDRDASVIFPPVDTERFARIASNNERQGFVTFGRLVPMKRTDILVQACNELELPLTVMGDGPDLERLRKLAGPTVRVLGRVTDEVIDTELSRAKAFLFASYEDFGIAPIEAMAAGVPVLAYKVGGALDYVVPGKTGEFFDEQTVESLKAAIKAFDGGTYDQEAIRKHVEKFSNNNFQHQLREYIAEKISAKK